MTTTIIFRVRACYPVMLDGERSYSWIERYFATSEAAERFCAGIMFYSITPVYC